MLHVIMTRATSLSLVILVFASACATTTTPIPRTARRTRTPSRNQATTDASPPPSTPSQPVNAAPIAVQARAPEPLEFNITATSDLPLAPASTSQPYARIVEAAVAPLRPAIAECMRSLGAPAHHVVRITVDEEGALAPRPPQEFTLRAIDARCLDGVLRAGRVDPPPPRAIPYDLRVDVAE